MYVYIENTNKKVKLGNQFFYRLNNSNFIILETYTL